MKSHTNFSYLWKLEPNYQILPEKFSSKKENDFLQRMMSSLTPHANKQFTVYDCFYFLCCWWQIAKTCTNYSTPSVLLTFQPNLYIRRGLLLVTPFASEQKCKQWREQRFAYSRDASLSWCKGLRKGRGLSRSVRCQYVEDA